MTIAGTYKLFDYGYRSKNGQPFRPISDWYAGEIHYAPVDVNGRGFMSVTLRFAEKPEEFADVVAYCGTYEIDGNQIKHTVTMSVRPEYEGQRLDRTFKLENGVLELVFEDTPEFTKAAQWKRIL